jgi:hypothetical protein
MSLSFTKEESQKLKYRKVVPAQSAHRNSFFLTKSQKHSESHKTDEAQVLVSSYE